MSKDISESEFREALSTLMEYLTPSQIADYLLVSTPTIIRWSEGKNFPMTATMVRTTELLNKHPIWDEL